MSNPPSTALVTAGGTREPVDDIRFITNLSRGRFPGAIANALAARGIHTTLLATSALLSSRFELDSRITLVKFSSFADLQAAIAHHLETQGPPSFLLMAAAVSDYSPVPHTGKLSSRSEELVLRLARNPKLLDTLRPRCGPSTFLVGFKLLSRVSSRELIDVAHAQNTRAHLDLTVANDLQHLGRGSHPILAVTPEGAALPLDGTREAVARDLVSLILERANATPLPAYTSDTTPARSIANLSFSTRNAPQNATHAALFGALPHIELLANASLPITLDAVSTPSAVPPSSTEYVEAVAAHVALHRFAAQAGTSILLQPASSPHALLALTGPDADHLEADWAVASDALLATWGGRLSGHVLSPLLCGPRLIGITVHDAAGSWCSPFITPALRGQGFGDRVVEALERSDMSVVFPPNSPPLSYFRARGFARMEEDAHRVLLRPPGTRDDLRDAASVCLFEPRSGRVLLGRRKVGPWPDYVSFPGGGIEAGETPLEAALRELEEETGVVASGRGWVRDQVVYVDTGTRAYRVTNVLVVTTGCDEVVETDELEPRWYTLAEAQALRPMAAGTRRILRELVTRAGR